MPLIMDLSDIRSSVAALPQREILGSTLEQWTISLLMGLLVFAALWLGRTAALRQVRSRLEKNQRTTLLLARELLSITGTWFFAVVGFSLAVKGLTLQPAVAQVARFAVVIGVALQIARWANALVVWAIRQVLRRRLKRRDGEREVVDEGAIETTMVAARFVTLIVVYCLVAVIAADNLGFNVTALIAGLGVGGIAVALAVQNILGDLFGALSIVLDRPFVVGDFIIVGPQMGTVEHIGLKSTRVRALSGELLVFRNTDLLASRIQNYQKMQERRVVFTLSVIYGTPPELLEKIPATVRAIIVSQAKVRFDRCHFSKFADSALELEVVYYVLSADYNTYMDIQQAINLAILRAFAREKIEFAFPTRTLYIAGQEPGDERPARAQGRPGAEHPSRESARK